MHVPRVAPAPRVPPHAIAFRALGAHRCPLHHVQPYRPGVIGLPNTSVATIARWGLASAATTTRSRCCSAAPCWAAEINDRRLTYLLTQTAAPRRVTQAAAVRVDDPLGDPVGRLCASGDRQDHHRDAAEPLAPPVTRQSVSGAVRCPVAVRRARRAAAVPRSAAWVHPHVPGHAIPPPTQERAQLHTTVAPVRLPDPAFQAVPGQLHTTLDLASTLVRTAVDRQVPCRVVRFARWSVAEAVVTGLAALQQDWGSLRNRNRTLATTRVVRRAAPGQPLPFAGPPRTVAARVPRMPAPADRPVTGGAPTAWCLTLTVRRSRLGTVRVVLRCAPADRSGPCGVLVTKRLDWSARRIRATSLRRWNPGIRLARATSACMRIGCGTPKPLSNRGG